MRYEPFEIKGLKLEKEYKSTFPVIIQLVQNTKESTYTNFYGTIGDHYNLAYSIELPELLPDDNKNTNRNFVKLRNALNNLKSVKLSKHDLFKDFYVIKITDYSSTSRSIGSYEFLPLVFMKVNDNYEKIPQNRVGLIKNFTSKEAFIIIDKGSSAYTFNDLKDMTVDDDFIVDIYFKRRTIKNSDNYTSIVESHDGNSIIFRITNNNVDGKLSPIDLNRIRFTYDGTYLINSSLFAKIEIINSAGEIIELNRQLTADDYFKFLYKSNYKEVNFAAYQEPANTFRVKYTLLTNLLPINNNDNYKKFNIILSENTPWYYQYTSKGNVSFNKNNAIYWKTANNLGKLLITDTPRDTDNNSLFEVFPAYDNYERFVDVVNVQNTENKITNFDIHKYLLKQKVFNYDSDGFLEIFNYYADGIYVKSPDNTVNNNSFISFRFSNEYNNTILDNTITPYGNEITSIKISGYLVDNITADNFVKRVDTKDVCCGVFGDPVLNIISQNITSNTNNIIYPLDGDNERVQKIIGEEEIRSYNNNGFINIGFSTKENLSEELSDFRMSDDNENSVAVNMIRKKHAEAINALYDKFNSLQTDISIIKNKLKARMSGITFNKSTDDRLLYNNFSTKYLLIKPISEVSSFDIKITDSLGGIVIKREYNCTLNSDGYYILLPYYIMTNEPTNDRSGSGYIGPLDKAGFYIQCYEHLTDTVLPFYYEEGL